MERRSQASRDDANHDSLNDALDVIGTRCAVQVLLAAGRGVHRYEGFVEETGISEAVLAVRLRSLVADGILERRPYREPGQRTRSEYELTERGRRAVPIVEELAAWGAELSQGEPVSTSAG